MLTPNIDTYSLLFLCVMDDLASIKSLRAVCSAARDASGHLFSYMLRQPVAVTFDSHRWAINNDMRDNNTNTPEQAAQVIDAWERNEMHRRNWLWVWNDFIEPTVFTMTIKELMSGDDNDNATTRRPPPQPLMCTCMADTYAVFPDLLKK